MNNELPAPETSPPGHTEATECDAQEFGEALVQHIPSLRRYARGLAKDPETADDLVQETLTRAMAKRRLWIPGSNLRAWSFRILHNVFVNYCRGNQARQADNWEDNEHKSPALPNQTDHMRLRALEEAHDRLPDQHRHLIMLVAVQGLSYEEAADIMGIPVGTVRSRLSRARQRLKEILNEDFGS